VNYTFILCVFGIIGLLQPPHMLNYEWVINELAFDVFEFGKRGSYRRKCLGTIVDVDIFSIYSARSLLVYILQI
jgi:hypothetical protein